MCVSWVRHPLVLGGHLPAGVKSWQSLNRYYSTRPLLQLFELLKVCCFNMLSFGIMLYEVIDNKNTQHAKEMICATLRSWKGSSQVAQVVL